MRNLLIGMVVGAAVMASIAPAHAIIGGETATGEHTWIADLGHDDNGHGCGGGLVAPRWIVTAGHCLGRAAVGTSVRVGSNDRLEGGSVVAVASVHKGDHGDIGLVELEKPVAETPALVGPMPVSGPIRLLGWGMDAQENPTSPRHLKQLDTEVLGQCGGNDEICVKQSAEAAVCHGDSGTPAIVDGRVVAVTSRGPIGPCGAEGWTVYTAVAPHQAWIDSTIASSR
ncbi:S1 family peptidase [Lentzea albida]|uniref:Trypsin n=1 Tax=Lentzea albida TaxID=65499 RepID=A0A1H9ND90_9PSEU|nr:trypsin-like serine protease [Lentzea albida]SER33811.1 Trypsin [Lentzea albida]